MPRGKNYVNQGKGVTLQASAKAKASQMTICQYGTGCTRPDCIYRHPYGKDDGKGAAAATKQSREPCMAYLAGICTFSSTGCRKRHPPPVECQRLIDKYSKVKCRFGENCLTNGCLYLHPGDEGFEGGDRSNALEPAYVSPQEMANAFPPLGPTSGMTASNNDGPASASSAGMSANTPSWKPAAAAVGAGSWKPSTPGIPNAIARTTASAQQSYNGQQQYYHGHAAMQPGQQYGQYGQHEMPNNYSSFSANAPEFRPPSAGQR